MMSQAHKHTHSMASAALHLLVAMGTMVFGVITFRPPVKLLPSAVRMQSPGFISLLVLYVAMSFLRHGAAVGASLTSILISDAIFVVPLLYIAGAKYLSGAAMFLCASIGVDLVAAALGAVDAVDITDGSVRIALFSWEMLAGTWGWIRVSPAAKREKAL